MTSTSTSTQRINWPLILLAMAALIVAGPFLLAFFAVGMAITLGLLGKLLKLGVLAFAVWAVVMLFKGLFGSSSKPTPTLTRIETLPRVHPDVEMERERRESLAALDKELARAIAKKDEPGAR